MENGKPLNPSFCDSGTWHLMVVVMFICANVIVFSDGGPFDWMEWEEEVINVLRKYMYVNIPAASFFD